MALMALQPMVGVDAVLETGLVRLLTGRARPQPLVVSDDTHGYNDGQKLHLSLYLGGPVTCCGPPFLCGALF